MATVIKAGQTGPVLRQLATVDLADHLAEARQIVDEARRRAELIESNARKKAAELLAEADRNGHGSGYEKGYQKGHEEGRLAGETAARHESLEQFARGQATMTSALRRAVAEIEAIQTDLRVAAEMHLLNFAVEVAKKLTFAVGLTFREAATENLRRGLRHVESSAQLTVRVHSLDLESLKKLAPSVFEELGRSDAVHWVADETIAPGGCIIQSERTRVDASLETQVDELIASLLGGGGQRD